MIIDGNSLACRAAFAHNPKFGPDLMNSEGKLTGATYRFFTMLDRLLHQFRPTHIVVAWDNGRKTFRNEIDSEYKANRAAKNNDLYIQFSDIKRVLSALDIKSVSISGYEGDDIVGTYSRMSKADRNYIISGDKDSFQLVNDNTTVIFPLQGFKEVGLVNPQYIIDKYGITVDNFVLLKTLMGDDGDNIKGITGCGEKTAVKLINHYGSLENIVKNHQNIDVKGVNKKVKENICEWAPRSEVVKQLVTILTDVEVPYTYDECELKLNWNNALPIFEELEFNQLIKKLKSGDLYNG